MFKRQERENNAAALITKNDQKVHCQTKGDFGLEPSLCFAVDEFVPFL
jgi:hypothetical protein